MEVQVSQMRAIVVPHPCCVLPRSGASTSQSLWAAFSPWKNLLPLPVTCFPRIVLGLLFFTPPLPGLSQRPTTIWRSSYPPARTLHQKAQSWHLTLNTVCVLKRCEDGALWALERSECDLQSGKGTLCPAPLREHKLCDNDFSTTSRTIKCYIYVVCCQ